MAFMPLNCYPTGHLTVWFVQFGVIGQVHFGDGNEKLLQYWFGKFMWPSCVIIWFLFCSSCNELEFILFADDNSVFF